MEERVDLPVLWNRLLLTDEHASYISQRFVTSSSVTLPRHPGDSALLNALDLGLRNSRALLQLQASSPWRLTGRISHTDRNIPGLETSYGYDCKTKQSWHENKLKVRRTLYSTSPATEIPRGRKNVSLNKNSRLLMPC